jgi:hypothetical protein
VKKVCWISKINPLESKQNNEKIEGHVLWSCLSAMDVWGVCDKRLQKCSFIVFYFKQVVEVLSSKCSIEEF